jgi:DNA-binding transcriptional LysR family regulator
MQHPFSSGSQSLRRLAIEERTLLSGRFWGELRTFLAVAKAKSLSRAAEEVGLSRMTAGREIRRLQDAIGAQLVTFTKMGAALTPRGEKLALALQRVDQEIFALTANLRVESSLTEGVVRLSISDQISTMFLVPKLGRLAEKYPRICLETVSAQNYLHLLENRIDLLLGFAQEHHEELKSIRLGTLNLLPFASRSYVEKYGLPKRSNISNHVFVDSRQYSAKSELWASWRAIVDIGRTAYITDAPAPYAMMVKTGLGIGMLSSINLLNSDSVFLDLGCNIKLPLFLTALKERLQSRPVQIVHDFIATVLGTENPGLTDEVNLTAQDIDYINSYQTVGFTVGSEE